MKKITMHVDTETEGITTVSDLSIKDIEIMCKNKYQFDNLPILIVDYMDIINPNENYNRHDFEHIMIADHIDIIR